MASKRGAAEAAGQDWVVLASFENRHAAEHMLLSLGRGFRKKARKGGASAFVVSGNKDGSLKLTESRVLEAGYLTHTLLHLSASWMVGFWGTLSALKGVKAGAHAASKHESHVGSDEQRAHEIIAEAGPHAAIALVRCKEAELGKPSPPEPPTVAVKAGTAHSRSSSPAWTPAARTTGFAPRSTSPLAGPASRSARTARRVI
jgi:hypothetical protein